MVEIDPANLLEFLRSAVRDIALPGYGRLSPSDIQAKSSPEDLVTAMDLAVEAAITSALTEALPQAVVVGEESVAADPGLLAQAGAAELSVILDPIDGTWNFAHQLPLWGSILAVCRAGEPVFGAIYDPMGDHLLFAGDDGLRAQRDGAPTAANRLTPPRSTGFLPLQLMPEPLRPRLAETAAGLGLFTSWRCSAHEYRAIARGLAGWQLSGPTPMPWDHVAGVHLVRAAGGVARMIDGAAYNAGVTEGYVLAAASEALWERVAAALGPHLT